MSNRTPSLQEALTSHFQYAMSDVYTSIPGIIVTVKDLNKMIVDVQPSINMRSNDGLDIAERPAILNVPIMMPVSKEGGLTFPISVGTPVWLMFSMRGLSNWKSGNGYPTTPSDMRQFDVRDCVAIPGAYPGSQAPNDSSKRSNSHDPNDVVLVHNIGKGNEVEVRLKQSGDVEITTTTKVTVKSESVEIDSPESTFKGHVTIENGLALGGGGGGATMVITGNIEHTGDFASQGGEMTHEGKDVGATHKHGGIEPGSGETDVPV